MSKFKVGDLVVPHEFDGPPGWENRMREFLEHPGKITETWKVDSVTDRFYHISTNKWIWPERALTPLSDTTSYDLKEFTLAAMTSILKSESAWHDVAGIDEFGKMAVKIAQSTIKALQEAEKEGIL